MLKSFADKRSRQLFEGGRVPAFAAVARQAQRRFALLDTAETLRTLRALPSNRFEALGGDRVGYYSIRVNDQWRICFAWRPRREGTEADDPLDRPGDAVEVGITDYH